MATVQFSKLVKTVTTFRIIIFYHKQFTVRSDGDDFETNMTK